LNDHDLIARVRKQDKEALDELFSRHMQKVYAISFNLCSGNRERAQDLTQEALLKAVRNIDRFRGEASFSTWLYRIIYNSYLDSKKQHVRWTDIFSFWRWKKQKEDPDQDLLEEPPDENENKNPQNVLQGKELHSALQKALTELPDKQRIVFQLKVGNEMSIKEIAAIMGSAEGTVKSHLFRATRYLQKSLYEWKA